MAMQELQHKHKCEGNMELQRDLLAGTCKPAIETGKENITLSGYGRTHLGHRISHESHNIAQDGITGVWFCALCGRYGDQVFRHLAKPCQLFRDRTGEQNLSRIKRGLMPGDSRKAREFNASRIKGKMVDKGKEFKSQPKLESEDKVANGIKLVAHSRKILERITSRNLAMGRVDDHPRPAGATGPDWSAEAAHSSSSSSNCAVAGNEIEMSTNDKTLSQDKSDAKTLASDFAATSTRKTCSNLHNTS